MISFHPNRGTACSSQYCASQFITYACYVSTVKSGNFYIEIIIRVCTVISCDQIINVKKQEIFKAYSSQLCTNVQCCQMSLGRPNIHTPSAAGFNHIRAAPTLYVLTIKQDDKRSIIIAAACNN